MRTRTAAASALVGNMFLGLMMGVSQTAHAHGTHYGHAGVGAVWVPNQGGHPDPCWPLRIQKMAHPQSQYWWWRFEDCLAYYNLYAR
jgi:hypothetical protein